MLGQNRYEKSGKVTWSYSILKVETDSFLEVSLRECLR